MTTPKSFSIDIIENQEKIIENLHFGTNIPVLPEFYRFILSDFNKFNTKSIIVRLEWKIVGHALIYDAGDDILYFGFFRALNHEKNYIEFLINYIHEYAKKNHFKSIQGPINIPTFIFGWGFMEEGSKDDLFVAKPINPPIYQTLFLRRSFKIKSKQGTWEGELPQISTDHIREYDSNEYEIYQPKNWKEVNRFKIIMLLLSSKSLSPVSQITPIPHILFDNFLDFGKTYGDLFMAQFLRHRPSREFVGCCLCLPNPFSKNSKGEIDSIVTYTIVINKEHRGKGLGMELLKRTYDIAYTNNIKYMSAPIELSQIESKTIVKDKFHYTQTRIHLIMEREV